jgi:dipeptidyl-peptidase-4
LKNEDAFIWSSEKSGFNHLYKYNLKGKELKALTKGDFDVTAFYGVDEKSGKLYYQAAAIAPIGREVYEVSLDGSDRRNITTKDGTNSASFSSDYNYFTWSNSAINRPASYAVMDKNLKEVRNLENNGHLLNRMKQVSPAEFISIETDKGINLNAFVIKPVGFDKNKQYPVLMYVYGGPGSQTVTDSWKGQNYWWFQLLAQQGYMVVSVDNRGTGARGEEFKKMTYLQLGKYETEDQIDAAKYLANLPYVDRDRIGIFGWSYGGFMASHCILQGNDVFDTAIAVAPVTNWKWYDTIYTERFMRTGQENEEGYELNSPITYAEKLEGSYLLVHGNSDDNVHFQNSAEMAAALIKADKQFDTYFYPNRNHGIYGNNARKHLYTKMTAFLLENL